MPIHCAGFAANINAAVMTAITPLSRANGENLFTVSGNTYLPPAHLRQFFAGVVGGPAITRAQLAASSLARAGFRNSAIDLQPLNIGAEPLSPLPVIDWRQRPLLLDADDGLEFDVINGGAEDDWAFAFMGDVPSPDYAGWRPFRFTTAASAFTAEVWNSRALVAGQTNTPGAGYWECGGGVAFSTTARVCRLDFQGQVERPPIGGIDNRSDMLHPIFLPGELGVLGRFRYDRLPNVEVLPDAADNEAQEVILYLRPASA